MRNNLLLAAGLLALPRLGAAQTAAAPPRFYVGAGVSVLSTWPFHKSVGRNPVGPAFTAGMQLSPRLALQVGAGIGWYHYQFDSSSDTGLLSGFFYSSEVKETLYTVPVLLRYTFTSKASRLHFDGLGGLTLLFARGHEHSISINGGQTTYDQTTNYTDTSVRLTLGPAVRYALSPALELSATPLVNVALNSGYNFSNRFSSNFLLGVNYKFGQ